MAPRSVHFLVRVPLKLRTLPDFEIYRFVVAVLPLIPFVSVLGRLRTKTVQMGELFKCPSPTSVHTLIKLCFSFTMHLILARTLRDHTCHHSLKRTSWPGLPDWPQLVPSNSWQPLLPCSSCAACRYYKVKNLVHSLTASRIISRLTGAKFSTSLNSIPFQSFARPRTLSRRRLRQHESDMANDPLPSELP